MNAKEEESRKAYNRLAKNYNDTPDGRFTRPFKDELVSSVILTPGDVVLDVACGTGELLSRLRDKCPIKGVGVDISDEMIKVAKSRYGGFDFLVSSCAPLPFADATFDVLTVSSSFHHFPGPERFAAEAHRVLRHGGRIYIAEVYLPAPTRQVFNALILPLYRSGDVKVYSTRELIAIFDGAGFSDISVVRKGKVQMMTATR